MDANTFFSHFIYRQLIYLLLSLDDLTSLVQTSKLFYQDYKQGKIYVSEYLGLHDSILHKIKPFHSWKVSTLLLQCYTTDPKIWLNLHNFSNIMLHSISVIKFIFDFSLWFYKDDLRDLISKVKVTFPNINNIEISAKHFDENINHFTIFFNNMNNQQTKLLKLHSVNSDNFSGCINKPFNLEIIQFQSLETLQLNVGGFVFFSKILLSKPLSQVFPKLKHLHIYYLQYVYLDNRNSKFDVNNYMIDKTLESFSFSDQRLEFYENGVELTKVGFIDVCSLMSRFASKCKNFIIDSKIKNVQMLEGFDIPDSENVTLKVNCPIFNLETISILDTRNIKQLELDLKLLVSWESFFTSDRFPNIKSFTLHYCNVTENMIYWISDAMKNLELFKIYFKDLSHNEIKQIEEFLKPLYKFEKLQILHIEVDLEKVKYLLHRKKKVHQVGLYEHYNFKNYIYGTFLLNWMKHRKRPLQYTFVNIEVEDYMQTLFFEK